MSCDGFNMQPRISVPFDGAIDPATITNRTVFLLKLSGAERTTSGINQIVWDPPTHELSFHPDNSLEQHTTYLPPRVTTIAGAIDIQRVVDQLAWAEQVSSTAAIRLKWIRNGVRTVSDTP